MDSHSEESKNIWFQITRLDLSGKCKLFNLDPYGLIVKIDALQRMYSAPLGPFTDELEHKQI